MSLRACIFVAALLVVSVSSYAAQFSGQYLMSMCASDANGKELVEGGHIACQAYIAGVMDYHTLIKSLGAAPSVDFCVPEEHTLNQIQNRVQSYVLLNKKQHVGFIAAPAVALGLHQSFPCK